MKEQGLGADLRKKLMEYQKPMERMYYVFLVIILLYDRLNTTPLITMLRNDIGLWLQDMDPALIDVLFSSILGLRFLIVLPAIYTICFEAKGKMTRLLLLALLALGWFYAYYWRDRNDTMVFEALLLIVASYGRDYKKIGRIAILLTVGVAGLAFGLSQMGILPDYIDERGDLLRHSFGTYHCTDLAALGCYAILLYMFLKNGLMKWYAYIVIVVLSVLNICLLGGQISLFCVALAVIGCVICSIDRRKALHVSPVAEKTWQIVLLASFVVCAAVYFVLNFTYTEEPGAFYHSIGALSGFEKRIRTSAYVTRVFPFSWFGKYFLQFGAGGGSPTVKDGLYTFLDCSYIRVYVMYGVVAFVAFLLVNTGIQCRLMKKKQTFRMFLLAIVAFHCFWEHRMIDPAFNMFLLLPFAALEEENTGKTDVG